MKTLVAYFSRTGENSVNGEMEIITKGFTEIIAEKIQKELNSDIFKIEPVDPYPTDYAECVKRSRMEDETNNDVPLLVPERYETHDKTYKLKKSCQHKLTPYGGVAIIKK